MPCPYSRLFCLALGAPLIWLLLNRKFIPDSNSHPADALLAHHQRDVHTDVIPNNIALVQPRTQSILSALGVDIQAYKQADTTAVILNWSRFSNVLDIASLLCHPSLDDVIAQVFIWNNNLKPISLTDFSHTGCSKRRLRIYNSPENLYFQARFMACAQAHTAYCFIQDDDYLVLPEVILALHTHIRDPAASSQIYLLPPYEHLSSTLRTIHAPRSPPHKIHTGFAWLGHGTILRRPLASDFLALMYALDASPEEMRMADNYYALLANRVPEIWFDQGIELGGGQPFTVGSVGEERNRRHIQQAGKYLDNILSCLGDECPARPYFSQFADAAARNSSGLSFTMVTKSVCRGRACLLETNIPLLPPGIQHVASKAEDMLLLEKTNREVIGEESFATYLHNPPSFAVDGRETTAFISKHNARKDEYVALDLLRLMQDMELVLLVDPSTMSILLASSIHTSRDGIKWDVRRVNWKCSNTSDIGAQAQQCSARLGFEVEFRMIRVVVNDDLPVIWTIYEAWLH